MSDVDGWTGWHSLLCVALHCASAWHALDIRWSCEGGEDARIGDSSVRSNAPTLLNISISIFSSHNLDH